MSKLQVLLVEDDDESLEQLKRDLPRVFEECEVKVDLHPTNSFEKARNLAADPLRRYDLIISDTYKGEGASSSTDDIFKLVSSYKEGRFCPLIIFSTRSMPDSLPTGPFSKWVDKTQGDSIERAIKEIFETKIPQIARKLHDEIDQTASSYLWKFLEEKWEQLKDYSGLSDNIEGIVRNRIAVEISDLIPGCIQRRENRDGFEYYIYPCIEQDSFNLGDIVRNNDTPDDFRVILTPHCDLVLRGTPPVAKAKYVLLAKIIEVNSVVGSQLTEIKGKKPKEIDKFLRNLAQSPAKLNGVPNGRYWFLPGFLDIPYSFCDFLQIESILFSDLKSKYKRIATLSSPYAEALQSCFLAFYARVGISDTNPESINKLIP